MFVVYGIIAVLVIGFLVMFVYVRQPKYGMALGVVSLLLIGAATILYLSEDFRATRSEQKVLPEQIRLENVTLEAAYGSNYKVSAVVSNLSERYEIRSIVLKLILKKCVDGQCSEQDSPQKRVKIWLKAQKSTSFETYIQAEQLAVQRSAKEWELKIISSVAK